MIGAASQYYTPYGASDFGHLFIGVKQMTTTKYQKFALAIAGVSALVIGAFILIAPHAFYAGYGVTLGEDANLLSELRAPAANLAALAIVMLVGIFRSGFAPVSMAVATTVFLAFPAGRIAGLLMDGVPSAGVLAAFAIEVVIGIVCVTAFRKSGAAAIA
jgi:hypothetical protein